MQNCQGMMILLVRMSKVDISCPDIIEKFAQFIAFSVQTIHILLECLHVDGGER